MSMAPILVRNIRGVALVAAAAVMAGCATQGHPPAASIPTPTLQLLSSDPLQLPKDCDVRGGVVYRTSYVVQADGHVADVQAEPAPVCLQSALTGWVGSLKYAPPGEPVPTVLDWMVVTGRRTH
jgi:hypothetical protein